MLDIKEVKDYNEFVVKDSPGFSLRVRKWKCSRPSDLNSLEFIQESKNSQGGVDHSSTYNFFMTDEEIKRLCNLLQS
jgi:hypothetical protein